MIRFANRYVLNEMNNIATKKEQPATLSKNSINELRDNKL